MLATDVSQHTAVISNFSTNWRDGNPPTVDLLDRYRDFWNNFTGYATNRRAIYRPPPATKAANMASERDDSTDKSITIKYLTSSLLISQHNRSKIFFSMENISHYNINGAYSTISIEVEEDVCQACVETLRDDFRADNHLISVTDSNPDTLGNGSGYRSTRAWGEPVAEKI
ncbi:hypothetical protein CBL_03137 [Carabus blaptoides fortunei]